MQEDTDILINVNWGIIYYTEDNQYISALLLRYILNAHSRLSTLNTSSFLAARYVCKQDVIEISGQTKVLQT